MKIGKLHVITDRTVQTRFTHVELTKLALAGGADVIQFRDKSMSIREQIETAKAMRAVCRDAGARLIVNDRADIALATEADGVHVGQRDLPVTAAHRILGDSRIVGGSASTLRQALQAERDGADYVGFGHVFPTTSKVKPDAARGIALLEQVCETVRIPVIAIGGINEENLEAVLRAGAHGAAVIAAVCAADDPRAAAARLAAIVKESAQ